MNKRKKRFNEMMADGDGYGSLSATNESEEPKTTSIDDFYLPHKIQAFNDAYMPKDEETLQSETFTEARLREFFKAYVLPGVGDPLSLYLDALAAHGFHMSVTMAGEPAIIVEQRF